MQLQLQRATFSAMTIIAICTAQDVLPNFMEGTVNNMKNKTIKVIVQSGVVVDVKNIPDGYHVQIIDDDIEGHDVYNEEINRKDGE